MYVDVNQGKSFLRSVVEKLGHGTQKCKKVKKMSHRSIEINYRRSYTAYSPNY